MLPLTRNIFRQTATSFNDTTKRWKQESYYVQIKWWSFAVGELLKKFTLIHQLNNNGKVNNYSGLWMTLLKKDEVWYILVDTHVANDSVFIRQKVHLDFFFFFFFSSKYFIIVSLLKHFFCNVPEKSTQSDQICRDIRRVFLRERRARQWTAGFIFWYLYLSLNVVWWRHLTFDSWEMIPSLIHPVTHFRSARAAWFVQNNHRRKQQF